jgi:putative Holliday junction resolvase
MQFLTDYMKTETVEAIVCGQPASENTDTIKALQKFIALMHTRFPSIPIVFQDETLTSRKASAIILKSGLKKRKRREKGLVDMISAVLILQEYLGHLNDVNTIES